MASHSSTPTLAQAMAGACAAEGVRKVFALLGDGNMHLAAALQDQACEFTYVRHEHCAVSAAMAYARVTGELGVATLTCGPGLTQVMTALVAAVRARIGLVILVGESPQGQAWYNQELVQAPFVAACGATYLSVQDPRQLYPMLHQAFAQARTQSCPVVVGVPFDLQESPWSLKTTYAPSLQWTRAQARVAPARPAVAGALAVIAKARRIIVLAGRGVMLSGAREQCLALAARLDALLATTLPARGLFAQEAFSLNVAGGFASDAARRYFAQADLVIAVGTRLALHAADAGRLYPNAQVLHVDAQPLAWSQGRVASQHQLAGDAKLCLQALLDGLPEPRATQWRVQETCQDIANSAIDAWTAPDLQGKLDPRDVIQRLDAALPKDWMMVNSSGHCSYYAAHMLGRAVEQFLTIREFGAIGNGLAYAIGAAVARPDVPVVLFDGDGSFFMHVQELETIRRHRLKILVCVLNDGGYGSEVHKLRADGISVDGAWFGHDDLAQVAHGFGLRAQQVEDLNQLPALIDTFARLEAGPMVLDFHVSDQVLSPVMRRVTQR